MSIEQRNIIFQFHKAVDICLTIAAFMTSYFIKLYILPEPFRGLIDSPNYFIVLLLVIIIWPLSYNHFKIYYFYKNESFKPFFIKILKSTFSGFIILIFVMYILKITDVSRIMMCIFILTNILFLILSKSIIYKILNKLQKKGNNYQNILIIGGSERAKEVIISINKYSFSEYRILGCLGLLESEIGESVSDGISYIGTVEQLETILIDHVVDQIIFALPLNLIINIEKHIKTAEQLGISVHFIPDWNLHRLCYNPDIANLQIEGYLGVPSLCLSTTPSDNDEFLIKNLLDFFGAVALIILLLPVFGCISLLIKLCSHGSVFFTQERCGLNGRRFYMVKFRTMVNDAEKRQNNLDLMNESDGPTFKIKNDPRIIPFIGTFLRKSGLDELPQLFNVLKGEMSLVGPRPPLPAEVKQYDLWQRRRLSMKPGITCLWQCSKRRNDISFKEWMSLDLSYIDSWSLKLDFKILIKTAIVIFTGQGR